MLSTGLILKGLGASHSYSLFFLHRVYKETVAFFSSLLALFTSKKCFRHSKALYVRYETYNIIITVTV